MSLYKDEYLFVSDFDTSQYYNRLQTPPGLIPLLGFPRISTKLLGTNYPTDYVTPFLTCNPIGAIFAVAHAQRFTNAVLRSAGIPPSSPFLSLL